MFRSYGAKRFAPNGISIKYYVTTWLKRFLTSEGTTMDLGLKDRIAIVAAASRGIGFACARELAREGARVFLCSRDAQHASDAAQKIHEETARTSRVSPAM